MKKIWSKNTLIVLFALTSMTAGAYIVFEKSKKPLAPRLRASTPRKATLIPASAFKDDSELQACYEALLARDPQVQEGTVQLHMTVTAQGEIDQLKMIHSDMEDAEFTGCVMDKVKAKRLPASKDYAGMIISHKFNFHKKANGNVTFHSDQDARSPENNSEALE
jgi:hypothetical protein